MINDYWKGRDPGLTQAFHRWHILQSSYSGSFVCGSMSDDSRLPVVTLSALFQNVHRILELPTTISHPSLLAHLQQMPSGIFISFFSLHTLGPFSVNTGGGWMLVEIPVDPGTNIPVTEMPWLPQSDAHHELQQVVSAISTCLSVLSYCHVIDWWAVCGSKYLNVLPNKMANF